MHTRFPTRSALALTISIALLAPVPAMADNSTCDSTQTDCEGKSRAWLWGGLAALGVGAAAAGGGGGGGGGGGNGGGGGIPVAPPQEGGTFSNGQPLLVGGSEATWQQNVNTNIVGNVRNDGRLHLQAGRLQVTRDGELRNHGLLDLGAGSTLQIDTDGDLDNFGTLLVQGRVEMSTDASIENRNQARFEGATVRMTSDAGIDNEAQMLIRGGDWSLAGSADLDNSRNATLTIEGTRLQLTQRAEVENDGLIVASGVTAGQALIEATTGAFGNSREAIEVLENRGEIRMTGDNGVARMVADSHASRITNHAGARISSNGRNVALLHAEGAQATVLNRGTLTVTGDGAVAMQGARGANLVNEGVINLGTATDTSGRGMIAMKSDGSANLTNNRGGIINIHAADSFAFSMAPGGTGRLVNNGVVNVYGAGSGQMAPAGRSISGYTVGANADGSSGQLVLHDGGQLHDITVDSGFSRGTDASHVVLDDVVVGASGGEEAIRSSNAVWQAHAQRDGEGNIDVTMVRNDYRGLAAADQQQLAAALESGYRNDALFHGLEVADQRSFQQALSQLSGAAVGEASMRAAANADALWSQLAAQSPQQTRMLAFDGQANAYGVRGQGTAVQVSVPLRGGNALQLMTAALSGDLSAGAGQDRNQSRFAGLGFSQQWGNVQVRHQFGHEQHRMESQRGLRFGAVNEMAHSQRAVDRTLVSSMLSHTANVAGLSWTPRLKATAFDQREAAFSEFNAGSFGLDVAAGRLRGATVELGSQLQRSLGANWNVHADVAMIKPLAVRADDRQAWLQGAASHSFTLPGVRADGLDHRLQLGADYRRSQLSLGAQLSHQRLWGQNDAAASLHVGYRFK